LLIAVLGSTRSGAPPDSGLVACAYPLSTQEVPAAEYLKLRHRYATEVTSFVRSATRTQARTMLATGLGIARV
jgi:hypothetical protein